MGERRNGGRDREEPRRLRSEDCDRQRDGWRSQQPQVPPREPLHDALPIYPNWVDIPAAPDQPPGPKGVKPLLTRLTTTFPDLKLTIADILQDGDKVVVRAEMVGTQREGFMGFPSKNRRMSIQVVDIHQIKDGKIVRTWHTEDWMTGLHQLGVFEK